MKRRSTCVALAVAAGLAPFACTRGETPVQVMCDPPLMVSVAPMNMTVSVGGRARVLAVVVGTCGHPHTATWAVQDTATAAVEALPDSAGFAVAVVTGRSAGSTTLIATSTVDLTVKAAAAVNVIVVPPPD
jgi:hypothetical protein